MKCSLRNCTTRPSTAVHIGAAEESGKTSRDCDVAPGMPCWEKGDCPLFPSVGLGKRGQSPFSQQPLDNDRIEPAAVELSVLLVNPDLSKAARPAERAAGGVRREDPRDELPKPALAGTLDERL